MTTVHLPNQDYLPTPVSQFQIKHHHQLFYQLSNPRNLRLRIRNKCLTSICSGGSGNPIDRISFCGRGFLHFDQRKTSIILLSESVVLSPFVTGGTWFTDLLLLLSISIASCADCCCEAWNALIVFSPAKQSSYLFAYKI